MSTTGEEHHRSHTAGHVVMGLAAGALALAAAYLWLSDGTQPWRFTLKLPTLTLKLPALSLKLPALSPTAAQVAAPIVHPVVVAQPAPSATHRVRRTERPAPDAVDSAPVSVDQAPSADAQVAADAAAVGMTTRASPNPGQ